MDISKKKKIHVQRVTPGDLGLTLNGNYYTFPNTSIGIIDMSVATSAAAFTLTLDKPDSWAPKVNTGSGPTPAGITGTFVSIKLVQYYTISPGVFGERDATDPNLELHVTTDTPEDYVTEGDLGTYYDDFQSFISDYQVDGSYPHEGIRFPVVFNENAYNGKATKDGEGINLVDPAGLVENDPAWGYNNGIPFQTKNKNSLQPFLLLKYVLSRMALKFNFKIDGDFFNDPEVGKILLWNTNSLDIPQKFIGESPFVFWKTKFNVNELVPDITVVEFLRALQSRYNLSIFFNETTQKVQMSYREPIARSILYEDITPFSSPLSNFKSHRVQGILLTVDKEDTDAFSLKEELLVGTKAEDTLDINCGRLFQTGSKLVNDELVEGPRVSQPNEEKFNLRVFHYKGIVTNTTFSYPGADISGPGFTETLSGINQTFHKFWLKFQINRLSIVLKTDYPLRQLLRYNFELKRRFDRSSYLVKSIQFSLSNQQVSSCTVELYTMRGGS